MTSNVTVTVWKPGADAWEWAELPFDDFTSIDNATRTHLGFGELSFTLPAAHPAVVELLVDDALNGGRLITIDRPNGRFGTFTAERPQLVLGDDGRRQFKLVGAPGAASLLAWADLWPVPGAALDAQGTAIADVYPGGDTDAPAEDVIRHFVVANLVNRWATVSSLPLIADASLHRGTSIRGRGRFQSLWQLVQNRARLGGLGVDVGLVDVDDNHAQLHVSCYLPTDRTDTAVFAADIGTLRSWTFAASPPTVTRAIVGDAGEGTTRTFLDRTQGPPGPWGGYREKFIPSDSFDPPELRQTGDAALVAGKGGVTFDMTTTDTEGMAYQVDYGLGDTATVDIGFVRKSGPVSSVALTVGTNGEQIKPLVGDPNGTNPLFQLKDLLAMNGRRTTDIERT